MQIIRSFRAHHFFRTHKEFLVGLLVIGAVVVANRFPAGYTILGADVFQYLDLKDFFSFYHYEWFSRVSLFYGLYYIFDSIGLSNTTQLSGYLGVFLAGSYLSFWCFSRKLFPHLPKALSLVFSVFYATNIYTLFIFSQVWGFTPFMTVYIFVPVLTGLYVDILKSPVYLRAALLFAFLSFFLSASFINPAFAVVLVIYFLVLTVFLVLILRVSVDRLFWKKLALVVGGGLIMNAYWILPLLPQVRGGVTAINDSQVVDLDVRLEKTSNAIYDTIRLLPTSEQNLYYPKNFPYKSLLWAKDVVTWLSYAPFFFLLVFFLYFRKNTEKDESKLYLVFFSVLLVFIALVARVRYPFDWFNSLFFHIPGINILRGYDKLSIILPFLVATLFLVVSSFFWRKRFGRIVVLVWVCVMIGLALPFYLGSIQTKMSYILRNQRNYHTGNYSALVKIPPEYFSIRDTVNTDPEDVKISTLPFSPGSSIGRISLPDWKVNAVHFAPSLYHKRYVETNDYYVPGWVFAKEFEGTDHPEWITDLYGLLGIKYVLYHKDAKPSSVAGFEGSRALLERDGAMIKLTENDHFILYEIATEKIFPYIYSTATGIELGNTADGLEQKIKGGQRFVRALPYSKNNPKKLTLVIDDGDRIGRRVVLNERYDMLWRAEYVSPSGKKTLLKRDNSIQYANAWKTEKKMKSGGMVVIYHASEPWMTPGMFVTGFGWFGLFLICRLYLRKKV